MRVNLCRIHLLYLLCLAHSKCVTNVYWISVWTCVISILPSDSDCLLEYLVCEICGCREPTVRKKRGEGVDRHWQEVPRKTKLSSQFSVPTKQASGQNLASLINCLWRDSALYKLLIGFLTLASRVPFGKHGPKEWGPWIWLQYLESRLFHLLCDPGGSLTPLNIRISIGQTCMSIFVLPLSQQRLRVVKYKINLNSWTTFMVC